MLWFVDLQVCSRNEAYTVLHFAVYIVEIRQSFSGPIALIGKNVKGISACSYPGIHFDQK